MTSLADWTTLTGQSDTTEAGELIFKIREGIKNRKGFLFWFCLCGALIGDQRR